MGREGMAPTPEPQNSGSDSPRSPPGTFTPRAQATDSLQGGRAAWVQQDWATRSQRAGLPQCPRLMLCGGCAPSKKAAFPVSGVGEGLSAETLVAVPSSIFQNNTTQSCLAGLQSTLSHPPSSGADNFTHTWNLKSNTNKQSRNRLIDPENRLTVARGQGS